MMKFVEKEDIEAPIEYVFSQITDFEALERSAIRRGVDVQRVQVPKDGKVGMIWDTIFTLRGKKREMQIEITECDAPHAMTVETASNNLEGHMVVDLVALSRKRTRLSVAFSVKPKSLSARLLLQSLKLARTNLTRRFAHRMANFAKDMEDRYKANA